MNVDLSYYQYKAVQTAIYPEGFEIMYPALGLANEAGEVAGKVKKWARDDKGVLPLTDERRDAIASEMGDVLWYMAALAEDIGADLGEIAAANLEKLASRQERGTLGGDGDNR